MLKLKDLIEASKDLTNDACIVIYNEHNVDNEEPDLEIVDIRIDYSEGVISLIAEESNVSMQKLQKNI